MPKRIQRRRTKGWRMPEGATYVGRGSIWGNPWRVGAIRESVDGRRLAPMTAEYVVARYRRWLADSHGGVARAVILNNLHQLTGKDLACWCKTSQPCHADVLLELLELANGGAQ